MKTVLILTDFSDTADNAVSYLSSIADQLGVEKIILYHSCINRHPDMIMVTDVLVPMPSYGYELFNESLTQLNKIKVRLEDELGTNISIELVINELPILKGIYDISFRQRIDLVVLGICGSHYKGTNYVGRIPASLIKQHEFSLLIIPSFASATPVKTIMLACELDDILNTLPDVQIKSITRSFGAYLHIVNTDLPEASGVENVVREQSALHLLLDEIKPEFHYLVNKDVIEGLLEFSLNYRVDLIMAIPKKRGFLATIFHKSASKKLAVKVTKPLLLLVNKSEYFTKHNIPTSDKKVH